MSKDIIPFPRKPGLEIPNNVPESDSIWGIIDVLNTRESSIERISRVRGLVNEIGLQQGIFVAIRQVVTPDAYRLPLQVFDRDPADLALPFDDMVTAICGPLFCSEAIAAGYIVESATIAQNIIDGVLSVQDQLSSPLIEYLAHKLRGDIRFIPLGQITLYDYVARMIFYRHIKDDFERLGMSEYDERDLAAIVGEGIAPLARAFKADGYRIGPNFQDLIDNLYIATNLFIPFAGAIGGQPQTRGDRHMVAVGLMTGVRLFRIIDETIQQENASTSTPKLLET